MTVIINLIARAAIIMLRVRDRWSEPLMSRRTGRAGGSAGDSAGSNLVSQFQQY
jgi:hypothetical protein